MERSRHILSVLLCLLLALAVFGCAKQQTEKPNPDAEPTAAAGPTETVPTEAPDVPTEEPKTSEPVDTPAPDETPEPTEEPEPTETPEEVPMDVTGAWYTNHYGVVQGLLLNEDGTFEMTWENQNVEPITGTWALEDGKVILGSGTIYEPLVPEGDCLIWKDVISDRIVYTREKPEPSTPANPVETADNTAFLGVWQMDSLLDINTGTTIPATMLGVDLIVRITETELVLVRGSDEEPLPYAIENGVLNVAIPGENGAPIESHFTALSDGNLMMTMDGAENEGAAYIYIPIK